MIIQTYAEYKSAIQFIKSNKILAYDIETTGVNWRQDKIIGIGFGNAEQGYYLPLLKWDNIGVKLMPVAAAQYLIPVLQALSGAQLIAWNAGFDIRFTKYQLNFDLLPNLLADVMLLKHTADEEFPFGLKEVAAKIFGQSAKDEQQAMKESIKFNGGHGKEYYKADMYLMGKYCVQDCILTFKLFNHYLPIVKREKTYQYFIDEVMQLLKTVTMPMEERGVHLDMSLIEANRAAIQKDMDKLEEDIQSKISLYLRSFEEWFLNKDYPPTRSGVFAQGIAEYAELPLPRTATGDFSLAAKQLNSLPQSHFKDVLLHNCYLKEEYIEPVQRLLFSKTGQKYMFNILSTHHLKKLFFEVLGERPVSTTDKGNPQIDDEFLQLMAEKYDWAAQLIEYRKLTKLSSTYMQRFLDEQENGKFYPDFKQHRTVSGRLGSDLQQLPRPIKGDSLHAHYTNQIRKFIVAGPGNVLIGADYSSLEPTIFAHLSGDPALQNIFNAGSDFYSTVAIQTEQLHNVTADKLASNYLGTSNPEARQKAKAYALGIAYGMTGYKLHFELDIPKSEAEELVKKYLHAFPFLAAWMEESKAFAKKHGYIRVPGGRVRHLPHAKWIYDKHGDDILDSLKLWKNYHDDPARYSKMKELRKRYINELNNAINVQVQGLAARLVNLACIRIEQKLKEQNLSAGIVMQVHDEIVIECSENCADQVSKIMQQEMENVQKLSVPLIALPKIAKVYANCK